MMLSHTPTDAEVAWMDSCEKALRRWVRAQNRWFAYCDASIAAERAGVPCTVKRPGIPSKAGKHRAYDHARVIERVRGLSTRCENFPMLCALVGEPCNARIASEYVLQADGATYRHRSMVKA